MILNPENDLHLFVPATSVLVTLLLGCLYVWRPLPEVPDSFSPNVAPSDAEVSDLEADIRIVRNLRPAIKPPKKVKPQQKPVSKPKLKPSKPAAPPPLTLPYNLIGVVISDERAEVILQARNQTLHLVKLGDSLPKPDHAISVDQIEPSAVVFRKAKQTLKVAVEPEDR